MKKTVINGPGERGLRSVQSSPVKVSTSPVRATSSPLKLPGSPLKSSLATSSNKGQRKCQFATTDDDKDRAGSSSMARRGAGALDESDNELPGPSAPLLQICEDAVPLPKNCFRLVMLG